MSAWTRRSTYRNGHGGRAGCRRGLTIVPKSERRGSAPITAMKSASLALCATVLTYRKRSWSLPPRLTSWPGAACSPPARQSIEFASLVLSRRSSVRCRSRHAPQTVDRFASLVLAVQSGLPSMPIRLIVSESRWPAASVSVKLTVVKFGPKKESRTHGRSPRVVPSPSCRSPSSRHRSRSTSRRYRRPGRCCSCRGS